ncbi:type I restriction endonuclease subunit R [Francisella tularensis subsp. novicida]|uniref:type I restriction endonuclease subunit R n=1 Tax=Francisella tularensis TaxID=263 RepID=UPI0005001C75|nr:type I restriction endonuclease subunit R [Francisella tularensis]AJJ48056.1 type I site-specific deoxyribonuclease, HsdR family protein [Francisella tularensis subsp. novicida]APC98490.1 type I site-specific deoxyribonuclease, HsdR family protein [Francisella tularensis subsp. novicida]KFJ68392.1 type I site-specific deoxyribonuclease, HsdR family protein [Francisella tularensis subsp. novicida]MBK2344907.1 type I restriction endonuclease subunit R [Francisella tularensis subsp. novicida]M
MKEDNIENYAIDLFKSQGYNYIYAPDVAPDTDNPIRATFSDVVLENLLRDKLLEINHQIEPNLIDDAIKKLLRTSSDELLADNELIHQYITQGIKVEYTKDGATRGEIVKLIDFDNPSNNDFTVMNQFTIIENDNNKRPDLIIFVNGLPLVVIELKNATDENATIKSAFDQIRTYKATIPSLFRYNAICVISDGLEAKAGTISADISRFMTWKSSDGIAESSKLVPQLETLILGMLNPITLLDLIKNFIVFEKDKKQDEKGQTQVFTIKKLAAYHQYYAVNKALERTLQASRKDGDKKGGVVWHTQGSGKSLSMVFYAGKAVLALNNPTIVVITDRNDLDDQLFDTFAASKSLLRQTPVQANTREDLKRLLKVESGGIVFTTIQKFQPEEGNVYDTLSARDNIIVVADEAHRTQYGFSAKTVDHKDADGNVVGKKTVYGFAKYLRDALPNATYLGFTGTPVEANDKNTPMVFGDYVDIYDISQAIDDGATVPIYYESRLAKINLSEEGKELVKELDEEIGELDESQKAKAKWTRLEALIGSENRIKEVANDIVNHFEARQEVCDGKAMIVAMSRRIAVRLYDEIIKLRPAWHDKDFDKGVIKVVMTASSSDGPEMEQHHTSKQQRRNLANRMKDTKDELKLVIVRDMWLTGFDAPSMHTLYIDKPMQGHNLMQAIARVNRVYKDKPAGLVVDYLGIASDLKKALSFYSDSGGKGDPAQTQEKAVSLMLEKLEVVSQMFHGFDYEKYFDADTRQKLAIILEAEDFILGLENGKKRFVNEVTALSKAFAIAMPHDEAVDAKDEIAFFQAIKARLAKFDSTGTGKTNEQIETAIRQVIDKALITDQVIDIFDASGIKKPDISVLSDEFLAEVRDYKHKNIALETLKKLLNQEIKARSKTNLVQSKTLKEMLEDSIRRYHSKAISSVEFLDELINQAKEIKNMDTEYQKLGLTEYEYAFYTAVASNESAKELMQTNKLRELAIELFNRLKSSVSIDWTKKESVRAKLRVTVKRTLRQFGYPPDMQKLATDTVLKQAEQLAKELLK